MPIIKRETDYALRALLKLALDGDFLPAGTLAEAEEIPEDFLRKIMQTLHRAGIVESRQGPFGGYRLATDPAEVTLLSVLEAVQGRLEMNECFQAPGACQRAPRCPVHGQLAQLQADFSARMQGVTLEQMLQDIRTEETSLP